MKKADLANADTSHGPLYNDLGLILPAARQGHGVALGEHLLIKDDIDAGRLVVPSDFYVQFVSYWLMAPSFEMLSPTAAAFADWLQSMVLETLAPTPR
jgi:LysR family glycine cleavage system transcriptional activator